MSPKYYELDVCDWPKDYWVFWRLVSPQGPLELRPEYQEFVCRKCKRLDVVAALEKGISAEIAGPSTNRDVVTSCDHLDLVSSKTKTALETVPGLEARFFSFPSSPERFVMFPVRPIYPPREGRIFTPIEPPVEGEPFQLRSHPCKKCGRFRELTFQSQWFTVPTGVVLAGILLESPRCPLISWIGSQEVVNAIKTNDLKGWRIRKNAFRDE